MQCEQPEICTVSLSMSMIGCGLDVTKRTRGNKDLRLPLVSRLVIGNHASVSYPCEFKWHEYLHQRFYRKLLPPRYAQAATWIGDRKSYLLRTPT